MLQFICAPSGQILLKILGIKCLGTFPKLFFYTFIFKNTVSESPFPLEELREASAEGFPSSKVFCCAVVHGAGPLGYI